MDRSPPRRPTIVSRNEAAARSCLRTTDSSRLYRVVLIVAFPLFSSISVTVVAIIFCSYPASQIPTLGLWCSQSRSSPDSAFKLCPGQQISKAGLQKFRFGLIVRGRRVPHVGNQNYALRGLIGRQAFAFLAELYDLTCYVDHALGPLELVVRSLDGNGDLIFQVLEVL